jgi:ornithine racemase
MALLKIDTNKIISNIKCLNNYLGPLDISWTLIIKILSGHKKTIRAIIKNPEIRRVGSIGDSQLSSLKLIKKEAPWLKTVYIKPPVFSTSLRVVKYADLSFNTSIKTLRALNRAAKNLNKIHDVILMVELGEIREGILPEDLESFYALANKLKNINILGIGTSLGCMFGINPTYDKLNALVAYQKNIEKKFNVKLPLISGGSTLTLPLTSDDRFPKEINHLRIGGGAFMGSSVRLTDKVKGIKTDVFSFAANVIELIKKDNLPTGSKKPTPVIGNTTIMEFKYKRSYKIIVDFGLLDLSISTIKSIEPRIKFVGSTSDVTVFNLGNNVSLAKKYSVGKKVPFNLSYMGVATLMYSPYITKKVIL